MDDSANGTKRDPIVKFDDTDAIQTTREEIEAQGGEVASDEVIADTLADDLREHGVSVDTFPPAFYGEVERDDEEDGE